MLTGPKRYQGRATETRQAAPAGRSAEGEGIAGSTAGRLAAVKTIKIELAEEPGFRDHFAPEVAAARRVSGVFTASVVAADPDADMPSWHRPTVTPAYRDTGLP